MFWLLLLLIIIIIIIAINQLWGLFQISLSRRDAHEFSKCSPLFFECEMSFSFKTSEAHWHIPKLFFVRQCVRLAGAIIVQKLWNRIFSLKIFIIFTNRKKHIKIEKILLAKYGNYKKRVKNFEKKSKTLAKRTNRLNFYHY